MAATTSMRVQLLFCAALLFTLSRPLAAECTAPAWEEDISYPRGSIVSHNLHEWRAKRNTAVGVAPGTHKPTWADLGACESDPGVPPTEPPVTASELQIFGVWHCGNSYCDWSVVRDTRPGGEFDVANHWIIDRNPDPYIEGLPSVNLVVLSFLEPLELLNQTIDERFDYGVPRGMTADVVEYFKSRNIRVMVSMGGVTYTDAWNEALVTDPVELANLAFDVVDRLNLDGLEIDWENGRPTDLQIEGMEEFIDQYNVRRSDRTNHYLTLDLAVGNRYLQELSRRASAVWLRDGEIDYINAMVPRGEPSTDQWQEHVDGKSNYEPPILPKAPAKIAVSLWLTDGRRANENCIDYENSSMKAKLDYIQTVMPNGKGTTPGFLGYMFWAAECPATRNVCTTPPDSCEGGMGVAAGNIEDFIPIPKLRED